MKTIKQIKNEYEKLSIEFMLNPTKENKQKLDDKFQEYLELEEQLTKLRG